MMSRQRLHEVRQRLQRQPAKALKMLRQIVEQEPQNIEALELLAVVYLQQRKYDSAEKTLLKAQALAPEKASFQLHLGRVYRATGRLEEAITCFESVLRREPRNAAARLNLADALTAQGKLNEASHEYQRAIYLKPNFFPAHYSHAKLLARAGAPQAAVQEFQKALTLQPNRDDVLVDLGNVLLSLEHEDEAVTCFRRALEVNPQSIGGLNNLGNTLRKRGELSQAEQYLRSALKIDPDHPIVLNTFGLLLIDKQEEEVAELSFRKAIELRPHYSNAHYNLANLHLERGQLDASALGYQQALAHEPNHAEAHYRHACLQLLRGNMDPVVWEAYEWRTQLIEARGRQPSFDQPACRKVEELQDKTILVHAEQGVGDKFQFVRYLPQLKQRAARVLFECPAHLKRMLATCEGFDHMLARGEEELPPFDCHAPLLSLPGLLGTTLDSIPAEVPYLHAETDRVAKWKERLAEWPGFRIGIAWQGSTHYLRDRSRSIPLEHFRPLSEVPQVQLISLQKGFGSEQLAVLEGWNVHDLAKELDNGPDSFLDTTAVLPSLDLVVTSDTALAHLAGGLGLPVWVALSHIPEWRWLLDRRESPWYPTMRLFRQPRRGDWQATFAQIKEELEELVASTSSG